MGLFDGLHYGHRTVIRYAIDIAQQNFGTEPAVFTFDTDTVTSKGDGGVECIISRELKFELMDKMGVKYIYSPDFMNFRNLSAEEFVQLVICDKLMARYVVCGEDFRFGRNACGNVEELDRLCRKRGIQVIQVPPVTDGNGMRISSTKIRELVHAGEIERANRLLGSRFQFKLPVMYGHRIGRTLNFPTINQYFSSRQLIPRYGVYVSVAEVRGNVYRSVTNIGMKPTVGNTDRPLAETYIIGFDGELYGELVRVSLLHFIRPETKFGNLGELAQAIKQDISAAEDFKETNTPFCRRRTDRVEYNCEGSGEMNIKA